MSTTFVHIGDFHAAPDERNPDRYRALDQIVHEALQLPRLGAFLWPGDLFDATSTAEDRNAIDQRIQRMANVAPVVICEGNHDKRGDLEGFGRLKAAHPIYVITERPHVLVLRLATLEMAAIFVLPYPRKGGLVGAGVAAGDVVTTGGDLLEPIFMHAAAELETHRANGLITLMIGHVNVAGSRASTGQPQIGHEIELSPRHLDRLGPIPKLLNHIHRPQEIAGAFYAGSVCRQDYGEIEAKRYLVVGVGDGSWGGVAGDGPWSGDTHQAYDVRSCPIDIAPMFHVEGSLTRDSFEFARPDGARLCGCIGQVPFDPGVTARARTDCPTCHGSGFDWSGCDVRVRYTYNASERSVLSEVRIRELFVGARRLKIESVAQLDRELRAPEVAAARTLPEKLAAYRKVDQLAPAAADKLTRLQQQEHDALLDDVAAAIAAIEQGEEAQVAA